MDKVDFERSILEMATPLLLEIYGEFRVDLEQKDRPDAAIILSDPANTSGSHAKPRKVGIEITSVDKQADQQYLNDEKYGQEIVGKEVESVLQGGTPSENPIKRIEIPIKENYIYDGISKKAEKYQSYAETENYDEIILLCYSDIIWPDHRFYKGGLKHWTDFTLSRESYPFDRVIFVSTIGPGLSQIYSKRNPRIERPRKYKYSEGSITAIQPGIIPLGTFDLSKKYSNPPAISPRASKKPKRKK